MKKRLLLLFILLIGLGACSNEDGSVVDKQAESDKEEVLQEEPEESSTQEDSSSDDIYFKDDVAQIEDVKIEITETKVIPVGEEGNEHGEKPVFAIWYEATNLTDEDIDPITAWIAIFTAVQDNDPDMINELEVGSLPDKSHLDTQTNTIKKDGTVENSIAYELDDNETPVTLIANQGLLGDEIGRKDYEIK